MKTFNIIYLTNTRLLTTLILMFIGFGSAFAQDAMKELNTVPGNVSAEIIVVDEEGRARAQQIFELYKVLSTTPTIEAVK